MRIRLVAVVGLLALLAAGCTSDGRSDGTATSTDNLSWVRGQADVASVQSVAYDDPSQGSFLRVTLDPKVPDATVKKVVHSIKAHFDDQDDQPGIEVDLDSFRARVYPGLVTFADGISDPDLLRALWLRRDGRATSYGDAFHSTVSSHPRVIAPARKVAQLAIDYDAAVTHDHDVRRSDSVESADGTTGVEWTTSTGLGFKLDTRVVGAFAKLQAKYPGTTGWIDCDGIDCKASIVFSPADVPLQSVRSGSLIDPSLSKDLELGWGPFRETAADFAKTTADPKVVSLLNDVRTVPGVVEVGEFDVVVDSRAAFDRIHRYVQRSAPRVDVSVQRKPVLFGYPTEPVLTCDASTPAAYAAAYSTFAGLPGIAHVQLANHSAFANLTIDDAVTDAELRTALTTLRRLPGTSRVTQIYAEVPGDYAHDTTISIGKATSTGFTPAEQTTTTAPVAHPDLVKRVAQAWRVVRGLR